eukprot:gene14398-4238_t
MGVSKPSISGRYFEKCRYLLDNTRIHDILEEHLRNLDRSEWDIKCDLRFERRCGWRKTEIPWHRLRLEKHNNVDIVHLACSLGNDRLLAILLKAMETGSQHAQPAENDSKGWSEITHAAYCGNTDCLMMLVREYEKKGDGGPWAEVMFDNNNNKLITTERVAQFGTGIERLM